MTVDSLGGLRRYLKSSSPVTITGRPMKPDSLLGTLTFNGAVHGWLDSLAVRGALDGRELFMNGNVAHRLAGSLALESVRGHTSGNVALRADTVVAGGLRVRTATFGAQVLDKGRAHFDAGATMPGGASLLAAGNWFALGDTARITLDTMNLALGDARWTLRHASQIVRSPAGVTMDTLVLASANGGRLSGFVNAPNTAPAMTSGTRRVTRLTPLALSAVISLSAASWLNA